MVSDPSRLLRSLTRMSRRSHHLLTLFGGVDVSATHLCPSYSQPRPDRVREYLLYWSLLRNPYFPQSNSNNNPHHTRSVFHLRSLSSRVDSSTLIPSDSLLMWPVQCHRRSGDIPRPSRVSHRTRTEGPRRSDQGVHLNIGVALSSRTGVVRTNTVNEIILLYLD